MSKHYIPGQATRDIFNVIFSLLVKAVGPIQVRLFLSHLKPRLVLFCVLTNASPFE
jgi:hypothetical protein